METYEQKIEIPFGAKDSELQEWTYTIPEGMEAEIKNGKVIIKRKESEDERIRKDLIKYLESDRDCQPCQDVSFYDSSIAWLEKHKDSVSNAKYIEDVAHAFEDGRKKGIEEKQKEQKPITINQNEKEFLADEITAFLCNYDKEFDSEDPVPSEVAEHFYLLGKQAQEQKPAEWSEEDEHRRKDAIYFLETARKHYADTSEIELTIDWLKSLRPSWKPSEEQKPEVKQTGWVARDRNGEIWVYGAYPEKKSERQIWTESICMPLNRKSFPDLKWEDEPMEVEITIRKK